MRRQFQHSTTNVSKTIQTQVEGLLEAYIRDLPFSEQEKYLKEFARSPSFERLSHEDARTVVLGRQLELRVQRLSRLEKDKIAQRLRTLLKNRNVLREEAREQTKISEFELALGDDGPIATAELAEYLLLLNRAYAVGLSIEKEPPLIHQISEAQQDNLTAALREKLKRTKLDVVSGESFEHAEITINRASKSSPFLIWGVCQMTVLCIAVIISGGEVNLKEGKFKVHPLGDGIRKLRAAFAPAHRAKKGRKKGR